MGFGDFIPWPKNQHLAPAIEGPDPFFTLHREVNRLFDVVFRAFAPDSQCEIPSMESRFGWPKIELSETSQALKISSSFPA